MTTYIDKLPNSKWTTAGRQVILKSDFVTIEQAILEIASSGGVGVLPMVQFVDDVSVKVVASEGSPVRVQLNGFPNVQDPQTSVSGGLCDNMFRENTADETLNIGNADQVWGTLPVKASQLYLVYAIAESGVETFTLKAMPILALSKLDGEKLRHAKLEASFAVVPPSYPTYQTYGFGVNDFIDGYIYVLSGAEKGKLALITTNTSDGTGEYISFNAGVTSLAAMVKGDTYVVIPAYLVAGGAAISFRYLGQFYVNASLDIIDIFKGATSVTFATAEVYYYFCILKMDVGKAEVVATGGGGGGGGGADCPAGVPEGMTDDGGSGSIAIQSKQTVAVEVGKIYRAYVAGGGAGGAAGPGNPSPGWGQIGSTGGTTYIVPIDGTTGLGSVSGGGGGAGCEQEYAYATTNYTGGVTVPIGTPYAPSAGYGYGGGGGSGSGAGSAGGQGWAQITW